MSEFTTCSNIYGQAILELGYKDLLPFSCKCVSEVSHRCCVIRSGSQTALQFSVVEVRTSSSVTKQESFSLCGRWHKHETRTGFPQTAVEADGCHWAIKWFHLIGGKRRRPTAKKMQTGCPQTLWTDQCSIVMLAGINKDGPCRSAAGCVYYERLNQEFSIINCNLGLAVSLIHHATPNTSSTATDSPPWFIYL